MTQTNFFVVPAPGHYGDTGRVFSSHRSLSAANKASGSGYVVREGALKKGDKWLRVMEQVYPVAK